MTGPAKARRNSLWTPLSEPLFRGFWTVAVISYVGTWMQNVGAGWLMTSLTSSPILIGLVQAAMSLPVFLVALPAGALADIVDRRTLLICTQMSLVVISATLGVLTLLGLVGPPILLGFTFLLGIGTVINDPAWQAITLEIVSPPQLAPAVAVCSAAFNLARAVGPALGGLIIALAGTGTAFLINSASFLGVIVFLYRWKRQPVQPLVAKEHVLGAMRSGMLYLRKDPAMRAVLLRTGIFSVAASALWSMLPLIARSFGSLGYGSMLSCFGVGALCGASALARLRYRLSADAMIAAGTVSFAVATFFLGRLHSLPLLCGFLFFAGLGWIVVVANLNVATQTISPSWVRARALSMYVLVLQGGLAAGSVLWGVIAYHSSIYTALAIAAAILALGLAAARAYPVRIPQLHAEPPVTTL
ncbi:MAG: MFS transporter [Acidobacteriaceae bacterium]